MPKKYDALTKSKITSGLQCHKKLWFDIHQPIRENKLLLKEVFVSKMKSEKFMRKVKKF